MEMRVVPDVPAHHVLTWMGHDLMARLIVSDQLVVRWNNPAAKRLIDSVAGLDFAGDKLILQSSVLTDGLRSFVRASGQNTTNLCLYVSDGELLLCTAVELGGAPGERLTGLALRSTAQPGLLASAALEIAFRLTGAERRVVELMFVGQTAEEVSHKLGTSIGTVRVHIRHIYEKIQVSSREAMFHKLMPFVDTAPYSGADAELGHLHGIALSVASNGVCDWTSAP